MNTLQEIGRRTAGLLGRESRLIRRLRPAYESLLDRSGNGLGISWAINGVDYRVDPHHRHRLGQNYDPPVAAFLRERVKPGAVCFNVGANVGVYVLQFAHWSGPTGRVVAFEPNPAALTVLVRHVQMNGLTSRVTIIPAAIGAVSGNAVLYAAGADGMSRLGAPNKAIADRVAKIEVPITTIDEYHRTSNLTPDWLFMDIEGFEIAALKGARQLLKSLRKKLGIIVEMHPDLWESAETNREDAESLLS